MDVLDRIVHVILEDPFLTARQIARRLGYAEEKTIYYWIEKAHYSGLTAFKRAVLNGQFRPGTRADRARETMPHYGTVRVVDTFDREGRPVFSGAFYRPDPGEDGVQYAWRYPGPHAASVMSGDLLLLSPWVDRASDGVRWCLAIDEDERVAPRLVVALSRDATVVLPDTLRVVPGGRPLYLIRRLVRSLDGGDLP